MYICKHDNHYNKFYHANEYTEFDARSTEIVQ